LQYSTAWSSAAWELPSASAATRIRSTLSDFVIWLQPLPSMPISASSPSSTSSK